MHQCSFDFELTFAITVASCPQALRFCQLKRDVGKFVDVGACWKVLLGSCFGEVSILDYSSLVRLDYPYS